VYHSYICLYSPTITHKGHLRYVRNNNPTSAYAMHIPNNRHEFGPAEETLELLKQCTKGTKMNCWETVYTHMHYRQGSLIPKQQVTQTNPLFELAIIPRNLHTLPTLGHVKEPNTCSKLRGAGKIRVFSFLPSLVEASRATWCGAPLEMKEGTISGARVQSVFRLQCWISPAKRPLPLYRCYTLYHLCKHMESQSAR
jgi:hypothetical protein